MFFIFDNLSATLIGIGVMLVLVIMQQRVQRVAVEQVMMYSANQSVIDLEFWLKPDMENVGRGVVGSNGITTHVPNDSIPTLTKTFSFNGALDSTMAIISAVQYQLVPAVDSSGTPQFSEINGTSVPLWQIQRFVDGNLTGISASYVTHFRVELEDDLGVNTSIADAEQVSIQVSMGMPFSAEAYIPETHWGTTVVINN